MTHFRMGAVLGALLAGAPAGAAMATDVVTYHYDNLRTGWNQAETTLTAATVGSAAFGLQQQVALDEQVDAQPLFLGSQPIANQGTFDVVYVATENNSIYAIDAATGNVLLSQNYGTPVPISALPGGCNNNSNNMGINSTPVIDRTAGTMYAVTYTYENSLPTFRLHAIDISTLQDKVPSVIVGATGTLKDGKKLPFAGANNRQRAGLVETGGNIYAGFASWCDINHDVSRGWVLGWNAATLAPLPVAELVNQRPRSPDSFFLSSVWMSGYGIASDDNGDLFFVTGNSDYSGSTYNSATNIAESVVEMTTDLSKVESFFTPKAGNNGWHNLDRNDADFGAAGVLLLPDQPGAYPHLAVAAGKSGPLYLLNRDNLGGLGNREVTLGTYSNNGCWCGQSYYVGGDGVARVLASTGSTLDLYKLLTTPKTRLVLEASAGISSGQDPGFFTSVSSNATTFGSHVLWAIGRPTDTDPADVTLYAFDPATQTQLFSGVAGTWPFAGSANANLVPVVANGHVFVASYANLSIFGLNAGATQRRPFQAPPRPKMAAYTGAPHQLFGRVVSVGNTSLTLATRDGKMVAVDFGPARAAADNAPAAIGTAALVRGDYRGATFVARYVLHAKPEPSLWGPDR